MNTHIVPTELIPVTEHDGKQAVSLRDLHAFLEVSRDFTTWARQMFDYGFAEHADYAEILLPQNGEQVHGGHNRRNWAITLDMAKELSMIQRTEKGKEARQYFIEVEKRGHAPKSLEEQTLEIMGALQARVTEQSKELEAARPKAEYVDSFVADNDTHLFRSVASTLMVGEMELRWALVYSGWIYHDQQRRRNSKNEYVTEHLWSEHSHKKPYFYRQMNHQAALFKGNVFYQLKITTPGVPAISRLVTKILAEHGTLKAALPVLEQRYNERKAS